VGGQNSNEGHFTLAIKCRIGQIKPSNRSPNSQQSNISLKPKTIKGELRGVIK
jgi:hypothetical protein